MDDGGGVTQEGDGMSESKKKLLWVGDAVGFSGFSRVTHGILDALHEDYDVGVLGVGYKGQEHSYPYRIWAPPLGDPMGYNILLDLTLKWSPNVVVLFNDLWVVKRYINKLRAIPVGHRPKVVTYSPVDAQGIIARWVNDLGFVDRVCTYTEFAKKEMTKAGYEGEIAVVPHGVSLDQFRIQDQKGARKVLGIDQGVWMVLNANTNTFRKRVDLTIKGFVDFVRHVHPVKVEEGRKPLLHLHMFPDAKTGIDIKQVILRECRDAGLNPDEWIQYTKSDQMPLSVPMLNLLYNASDVGINTSLGEGWGLCPFEMAAVGKPQIVTDFAAMRELWTGNAWMLPVEQKITIPQVCTEGGLTSREHVARALIEAYTDEDKANRYATAGFEMVRDETYRWPAVASAFMSVLDSLDQTK